MNDIKGESNSADKGGSTLHDVPGIQRQMTQIGKAADALATDDALVKRVIEAVHSGSSSALEKIFTDIGVDSQVTVTTVDGAEQSPPGANAMARSAAPAKTRTITVTIGIGPISISVTVKKDSK